MLMRALTLALALVAGTASAQVDQRHLSRAVRGLEGVVLDYCGEAGATLGHRRGEDCIVATANLEAAAAPAVGTSSIGAVPYAAKLNVRTIDLGSATTTVLTCGTVDIKGYDWSGRAVSERVSTIGEAEKLTQHAYSEVTSVAVAGCNSVAASADASDRIVLVASDHIAFGRNLRRKEEIVRICAWRLAPDVAGEESGNDEHWCAVGTQLDADHVDFGADTFDFLHIFTDEFVFAIESDNEIVTWSVRAPKL